MAQSQIHRDCHELNQAGQNHSTSRRDRRPVRGRPVRGITVGCHRPPPSLPGCLGRARWAQGSAGDRGASPVPERLGPAGHTQDHAAKPCGKNQVLAVPAEHAERFEGASLARIWRTTPASAARLAPPTLYRRCRLWAMRRAAAARPGLVCEGVSDGLVGQSSFQFVSAAPVIGHSAAYRCR